MTRSKPLPGTWNLIVAKYDGYCTKTCLPISPGDVIWWRGKKEVQHGAWTPEIDGDRLARRVYGAPREALLALVLTLGCVEFSGKRRYAFYANKQQLTDLLLGTTVHLRFKTGPAKPFRLNRSQPPSVSKLWIANVAAIKRDDPDSSTEDKHPEPKPAPDPAPAPTPKLTINDLQEFLSGVRDEVKRELSKDLREQVSDGVRDAVLQEVKSHLPNLVTVKLGAKRKKSAGLQHKQFATLLKLVAQGLNVYMVGPAASGKSRAGLEVAKTLELPFFSESVCQQSPASLLKGYVDGNGKYVRTNFREAFEKGGVFLLDEIDAGNPNVLTVLNAATAADPGEPVSFPDGMVPKHPKFVAVAAANTVGRGGDREYVGRNPLDGASLDRFVFLDWETDEILERTVAEHRGIDPKWVDHVQRVRAVVLDLKIRLIVSPRATFYGGAILQAGLDWKFAESSTVYKGLDSDAVSKIQSRLGAAERN